MKIVIFTDDGMQDIEAPDGTLRWSVINHDGSELEAPVDMYVYRELSIHKFAYIVKFRHVTQDEIDGAVIQYGYDV